MKTLLQLAVFASCLPAYAQTPLPLAPNMVPICNEGCTITAISSPTAVLQFGVGTTWGPAFTMKTFPQPIQMFEPANMTLSPFDPKPRSLKGIDAQQQATAYTVTYTLNGVQTVKTIPGLLTTYLFLCKASVPAGTMPATLPIICGAGVKQ